MDIKADIVSGRSLGGIELFSEGLSVLSSLHAEGWSVQEEISLDGRYTYCSVDGCFLVSIDNSDLKVKCLVAYPKYEGRLYGYIHPGITVSELLQGASSKVREGFHIYQGFLYLDREEGAGFLLPPEYDDFDTPTDLPEALTLEGLYILPPSLEKYKDKNGKWVWRVINY